MGEILAPPHADLVGSVARDVMEEVISVASKVGLDGQYLSNQKEIILEATMKRVAGASRSNTFKPSMLVDVEAGRPMEVEVIIGEVVRKAAEHGVSVPRWRFRKID
jgi:2-dehydropantoate 2-reductase